MSIGIKTVNISIYFLFFIFFVQDDGHTCPICWDEIIQRPHEFGKEQYRVTYLLVCGHFFHQRCMDRWIFDKDSCPVCREYIPYIGGLYVCDLEQVVMFSNMMTRLIASGAPQIDVCRTDEEIKLIFERLNHIYFDGALLPLGQCTSSGFSNMLYGRLDNKLKSMVIMLPEARSMAHQVFLLFCLMTGYRQTMACLKTRLMGWICDREQTCFDFIQS